MRLTKDEIIFRMRAAEECPAVYRLLTELYTAKIGRKETIRRLKDIRDEAEAARTEMACKAYDAGRWHTAFITEPDGTYTPTEIIDYTEAETRTRQRLKSIREWADYRRKEL